MDDETAERIVVKAEYVRDCIEILAQKQSLDRDAYLTDRDGYGDSTSIDPNQTVCHPVNR